MVCALYMLDVNVNDMCIYTDLALSRHHLEQADKKTKIRYTPSQSKTSHTQPQSSENAIAMHVWKRKYQPRRKAENMKDCHHIKTFFASRGWPSTGQYGHLNLLRKS